MKMKMKNYLLGSLAVMAMLFMASCGEDEESIPVPSAAFTIAIDGKTITTTNTSTDGETYAWDFGDGMTSTEMAPSHTYDANGSYVIKLTVTNASGMDDTQAVAEIINIAIDGDFSEWADIAAIPVTYADGTTLTTIKIENLGNTKLFVYVEGTSELTPLMQMPINIDNDRSTGAFIDWIYFNAGEDFLVEGALPASDVADAQYASLYPCSPCDGSSPGNWNWGGDPVLDVISDFIEASALSSVSGGLAFEFAMDLTAFGAPVATDAIGIGFLDISLDTWGPVAAIPGRYNENDNAEGTLYYYTFK